MKNEFSSSEVTEYNEAECDWLNLNPIYCNNQSSGVTEDNTIEYDKDTDDVVVSKSSGVTGDFDPNEIDNNIDSDVDKIFEDAKNYIQRKLRD